MGSRRPGRHNATVMHRPRARLTAMASCADRAIRSVRVWLAIAAGRPAAALAHVERLCIHHPASPWAHATRCQLLATAGRRPEALLAARDCVAAHGGRHDRPAAAAWFNLGYLLEAEGGADEARAAFEDALQCDPRMDRAWYGLGLVHLKSGRLDEAAQAFAECTRLQPMAPPAWYQLARLAAERGRLEEARELIAHLRRFEPRVAAQLQLETGLEHRPG
jgi:tetratricopeptide (TPR) repeat protein